MAQQKRLPLAIICVQLFGWMFALQIEASEVPLTQNELRDKYGQGICQHLLCAIR